MRKLCFNCCLKVGVGFESRELGQSKNRLSKFFTVLYAGVQACEIFKTSDSGPGKNSAFQLDML